MRVRNDISNKNEYKLSKHRFLELKHMCLQYDEWRDILRSLDGYRGGMIEIHGKRQRLSETDISWVLEICLIFKYLIKSIFESIGTLARYTVLGFTTANNSRIEAKFMNPDNWDDGMF